MTGQPFPNQALPTGWNTNRKIDSAGACEGLQACGAVPEAKMFYLWRLTALFLHRPPRDASRIRQPMARVFRRGNEAETEGECNGGLRKRNHSDGGRQWRTTRWGTAEGGHQPSGPRLSECPSEVGAWHPRVTATAEGFCCLVPEGVPRGAV